MPDIPTTVSDLINRFKQNIDVYKKSYNETMLRKEFIDPFFEALGWDVSNKSGYAEAYKDVIHEAAVKVGGKTKAPDYAFRIGGIRKFFLEAKKPAVDIKENIHPAYQLRRYAWSAKLPLSILTDFEEFAVYDCRIKPVQTDKASTARIMYISFEDYPERWDEITSIFAKEAVLKGSFDRYIESTKRKRGTAEVDSIFLKEIEVWRESLARNIAIRNTALSQREVNFAVARTIDRIIFLRICEDRGMEDYGQLMSLQNGTNIYKRLVNFYRRADEKYNSGLFHFRREKERLELPDELTPRLTIDDKIIKDILKQLYYPDSPYEFSVLPADILGHIYEQFLGKVIRLTPCHHAKVEEKPEVRKAGGVYYTPTYIVDYIVKNTVGKLLGKKTPRQMAKLKILDPACGSGSFLIGAYQYLLDWHRDWYVANDPEKWAKGKAPAIYRASTDDWRLTTAKRKEILLNNIYGVDIDPQAVEVTKLSLLLKVLEGESSETINRQRKLFHERALPDLWNNIKCGNSLIGPDFYDGEQISFLDEEEQYRINAFDWEAEFPEIIKRGGFDVVIGNPPYVRIQTGGRQEIQYYNQVYTSAVGNYDIYCIFVEKGVSLLKQDGKMGYILPHRFFKTKYGQGLRGFISIRKNIQRIIDFDGYMVFKNASINTCILVLDGHRNEHFLYSQARFANNTSSMVTDLLDEIGDEGSFHSKMKSGILSSDVITQTPWVFIWPLEKPVWQKLESVSSKLGDLSKRIFQGLKTGSDKIYIFELLGSGDYGLVVRSNEDGETYELERNLLKPLIKGGQMNRYHIGRSSKLILFPYENGKLVTSGKLIKEFPKAWEYLLVHKSFLEQREGGKLKGDKWYAYTRSQALDIMWLPKIIIPDYYARASYCLDHEGKFYFCGGGAGGYGIVVKADCDSRYLLGLLNSRLLDWYLQKISIRAYQTAYMYTKKYIEQLPIRTIDFSDPRDKSRHDKIVRLVESMMDLNKKLANAKAPHDQEVLQRQIDTTDRQIDKLVYELYDLTEEEIAIVDESMRR